MIKIKDIKWLIKFILYGWKLEYHLSKRHKFNNDKHQTVLRYHYEMAQYYYEKIYDKPFSQ